MQSDIIEPLDEGGRALSPGRNEALPVIKPVIGLAVPRSRLAEGDRARLGLARSVEAGPRPGVRLDRDGGCPPGRRLSYSSTRSRRRGTVRRPSTANRLSELDRMLMRTYHNGVRPQARPPDTVTSHIECITTSACNQGHDQGPAVHHPVCVLSAACTQVTACSCTVSSPWECGLQSYGRSV